MNQLTYILENLKDDSIHAQIEKYNLKMKTQEYLIRKLESRGYTFWNAFYRKYAAKAVTDYLKTENFYKLQESPVIFRNRYHACDDTVLRLSSYKKRMQAELDFKASHPLSLEAKTKRYISETSPKFMIESYEVTTLEDFKWEYIARHRRFYSDLRVLRNKALKKLQ